MLSDPVFFAKLTEWQNKVAEIQAFAPNIEQERKLRQEVFALAFPKPAEGTNNEELPQGWKLKGVLKIDRKVDEAALPAVKEAIRGMGFNPDPLVKFKPELELKQYRTLPPEVMKVFDTALTIKPAMPSIELVPPKPAT